MSGFAARDHVASFADQLLNDEQRHIATHRQTDPQARSRRFLDS